MNKIFNLFMLIAACVSSGCEPSEERKARWAENRRIDCLDKVCSGDVLPKGNWKVDELLKINGRWFIGPKEYFSAGINGLGFEWWDHRAVTRSGQRPPEAQRLVEQRKGLDRSVSTFLRYNDRAISQPTSYQYLMSMEREGKVIERFELRPGLERWVVKENWLPGAWYVATKFAENDPNGAIVFCRSLERDESFCTNGFRWMPQISADVRFNWAIVLDWPEIYSEIIKALKLLKEVK